MIHGPSFERLNSRVPWELQISTQPPLCCDLPRSSDGDCIQCYSRIRGVKEEGESFAIPLQSPNVIGWVFESAVVGKDGGFKISSDEVLALGEVSGEDGSYLCGWKVNKLGGGVGGGRGWGFA